MPVRMSCLFQNQSELESSCFLLVELQSSIVRIKEWKNINRHGIRQCKSYQIIIPDRSNMKQFYKPIAVRHWLWHFFWSLPICTQDRFCEEFFGSKKFPDPSVSSFQGDFVSKEVTKWRNIFFSFVFDFIREICFERFWETCKDASLG